MLKTTLTFICFLSATLTHAQTVPANLTKAWNIFMKDSQLRAAMASIYVADAETGKPLFARNERIGLAPASTQKIITAASAYEMLGTNFRFLTTLYYNRAPENGVLPGNLFLSGNGDPTLGSWRLASTDTTSVLTAFTDAVVGAGIRSYGTLQIADSMWDYESIPDGWIWQDIGQYYGAGSSSINWIENQFEMKVQPGFKPGDPVTFIKTIPAIPDSIRILARTGERGSGDQSYFYYPANNKPLTLRGTLPPAGSPFSVSGSMPNPSNVLLNALKRRLASAGVHERGGKKENENETKDSNDALLERWRSPALDTVIFWFLRKSINLYGEALLKVIAYEKANKPETQTGVQLLKKFWQAKGIDPIELNIKDGSGLSPENRVTTHAQAQVLLYAKKQDWFQGFYNAFPEYNGMKLKSGTIGGVKGYCGYHTARNGKAYVVSFLVNNYNGSESALVRKMYAMLNELK
jgi:D-alanyl-D-alanine carboxypeptidase/D-alanyl-D-alanine-endopeptidase (penicillin-binding protein 4)